MQELLRTLIAALDQGRPAAWCRLVETRGSTPQKAGAAMLVFEDGSQAGTLGGGCVEAEVKRRALAIIPHSRPEVATFQLDSDYGWDDGLICGGRMQILMEPLRGEEIARYCRQLAQFVEQGVGCSEVVVYDGQAQPSLPAPAAYLFDGEQRLAAACRGTLVNGDVPAAVRDRLIPLSERPRAKASAGIAFLPILPRCRLLIVGGGHIGQAVGNMAADLDFDVWVVDDREEYVRRERFPRAERLVCGDIGAALRDLNVDHNTYCLIVTRGHNHDEEALYHLIDRGARYVGMIGSKRKIRLIFDDLQEQGISVEALSKVFAPVGIEIGSQTVPEIAVSILAELISHKNQQGHVPGRGASLVAGLAE